VKNNRFRFLLCLTIVFLILLSPLSVSANSAPKRWDGVTLSGSYATDASCPLIVENERLVFDIQDFSSDKATVTAEYTFRNPTSETITATLLFPFGNLPYDLNIEQYDITANGEKIAKRLRHSLYDLENPDTAQIEFDPRQELSELSDTYYEDTVYYTSKKVTHYTMIVEQRAFATMEIPLELKGRIFFQGPNPSAYVSPSFDQFLNVNEVLHVYVLGEPPASLPNWTFYESMDRKNLVSGKISCLATEELTLRDWLCSYYGSVEAHDLISEMDWYNALVHSLIQSQEEKWSFSLNPTLNLWYEYEITVPAGDMLVNSVTAPLFPDDDEGYDSPVYNYYYLLSPASLWSDFGHLEIVIQTPFHLIDASLPFEESPDGYVFTLDSLPDQDLSFTLSEEEDPLSRSDKTLLIILGFLLTVFLVFVALVAIALIITATILLGIALIVTLIVVLVVRRKKKKKQ